MKKIVLSLLLIFSIFLGFSNIFATQTCEYKQISKSYDDI
jgi:hypothetical protein